MQSEYIVVPTDVRKGEAAAARVIELVNNGAMIASATGTKEAVHYVIVMPEYPQTFGIIDDEEAEIIRDNLDTTHPRKK